MQYGIQDRRSIGFVVSGLFLSLCGSQAFAAGFAIRAQSASSIGTAGASDVSGTADITAFFTNPAALSAFKGNHLSVGGAYIMPSAEFKDGERTVGATGIPAVTDSDSEKSSNDFSNNAFIPAIFGTHEINDQVTAGWSVTVPWATSSDYGKDWVGRYQGTKTELSVLNIDAAASYKLMDNLKFGFGVQIQRGTGEIEGASNYGAAYHQAVATAAAKLVQTYFTAAAAAKGPSPTAEAVTAFQTASAAVTANPIATKFKDAVTTAIAGKADGELPGIIGATLTSAAGAQVIANEGKDDVYATYSSDPSMAFGFTFGVLYTPIENLDLGLSYRSAIVHKTEGDYKLTAESSVADTYINSIGTDRKAKLDIAVPDIIGFGATYKDIPNLQLFASASLTRWSKLRDFNVRPDGATNILVLLNWEDVWHLGVGAAYKIDSTYTVRAGLASDNSPTTDDLRSPRSPDDNRKLISLGGRYDAETWSVDLGLLRAQFRDPKMQLKNDGYPEADGRGDLKGSYTVSANTFMAQYNHTL